MNQSECRTCGKVTEGKERYRGHSCRDNQPKPRKVNLGPAQAAWATAPGAPEWATDLSGG